MNPPEKPSDLPDIEKLNRAAAEELLETLDLPSAWLDLVPHDQFDLLPDLLLTWLRLPPGSAFLPAEVDKPVAFTTSVGGRRAFVVLAREYDVLLGSAA